MGKLTKEQAGLLSSIAGWVIIVNVALLVLGISHGWTLFFANIFFFMLGADIKRWKELLFGGLFGLASAWLFAQAMGILTPVIGVLPAVVLPLALIIFFMIVCGPIFPSICNNVAFGYLTIATINMDTLIADTVPAMIVFVVGGTIMVGGAWLILRFFMGKAESKA